MILLQGRCSWFNHQSKDEEEEEEEEEDEEREEPDEPEPEVGPPLLTPLSEDAGTSPEVGRNLVANLEPTALQRLFFPDIDGFPAWTAVRAPSLVPQHSIAILHSNLWPGGHCFAIDRSVTNTEALIHVST